MREVKVPSEPEALVAFLGNLGLVFERIGLEAGPLSQWLHAGLERAGLPVVLIETRHVKAALSAMIMKTDKHDARGIARLCASAGSVHVKTPQAQEMRALLTARKLLVEKLRGNPARRPLLRRQKPSPLPRTRSLPDRHPQN